MYVSEHTDELFNGWDLDQLWTYKYNCREMMVNDSRRRYDQTRRWEWEKVFDPKYQNDC
jgi:hypothetical protein